MATAVECGPSNPTSTFANVAESVAVDAVARLSTGTALAWSVPNPQGTRPLSSVGWVSRTGTLTPVAPLPLAELRTGHRACRLLPLKSGGAALLAEVFDSKHDDPSTNLFILDDRLAVTYETPVVHGSCGGLVELPDGDIVLGSKPVGHELELTRIRPGVPSERREHRVFEPFNSAGRDEIFAMSTRDDRVIGAGYHNDGPAMWIVRPEDVNVLEVVPLATGTGLIGMADGPDDGFWVLHAVGETSSALSRTDGAGIGQGPPDYVSDGTSAIWDAADVAPHPDGPVVFGKRRTTEDLPDTRGFAAQRRADGQWHVELLPQVLDATRLVAATVLPDGELAVVGTGNPLPSGPDSGLYYRLFTGCSELNRLTLTQQ